MRSLCAAPAEYQRAIDGRPVCGGCLSCDPDCSRGFSFTPRLDLPREEHAHAVVR